MLRPAYQGAEVPFLEKGASGALSQLVEPTLDCSCSCCNCTTPRAKIEPPRALSAVEPRKCSLHLPPSLGCPMPSLSTSPASPRMETANYPSSTDSPCSPPLVLDSCPSLPLSFFVSSPRRVTSRDPMSNPNVPSMVHLLSTLLP